MVRTYARLAGLLLLAVAAMGLYVWEWRSVASFFHAAVGLLYLYVGVFVHDAETVRRVVGGLGVLLLLVKAVTIGLLVWGGRPMHGPIEITCLLLGTTSVLAARYLRNGAGSR